MITASCEDCGLVYNVDVLENKEGMKEGVFDCKFCGGLIYE